MGDFKVTGQYEQCVLLCLFASGPSTALHIREVLRETGITFTSQQVSRLLFTLVNKSIIRVTTNIADDGRTARQRRYAPYYQLRGSLREALGGVLLAN